MTDEVTTFPENQLDESFRAVELHCAQRGLTLARLDDSAAGYLGVRLKGSSRSFEFDVVCDSNSLTRLPRISLREPRSLLPHVGYCGTVCVSDDQGMSLDIERRSDIVAYTVLAAYDLLEKWTQDEVAGQHEFYNELEGYWLGLPQSCRSRAALEVDRKDRLVSIYVNSKLKKPQWYFTERGVQAPSEFFIKKLAPGRALYVHLDDPIPPPIYPFKLDASFIDAVHAKLSSAQLDLWATLLGPSKNGSRRVALLVSVPRPLGGLSLIGIAFGARGGHVDTKVEVIPLTVRRHTITYILRPHCVRVLRSDVCCCQRLWRRFMCGSGKRQLGGMH